MLWYGIDPLAGADAQRALDLAATAQLPLIRQYIARRVAADANPAGLAALQGGLAEAG